jgi:hypothetical protein
MSEHQYHTTSSGFRYRMLDATLADDYDEIVKKLSEGESLYRMHYGVFSDGRPFPALIDSKTSYKQSRQQFGPEIKLAAGIPVPYTPSRRRQSPLNLNI